MDKTTTTGISKHRKKMAGLDVVRSDDESRNHSGMELDQYREEEVAAGAAAEEDMYNK